MRPSQFRLLVSAPRAVAPYQSTKPKDAPRYLTDEMGRRVIARLNESLLIQAAQQSWPLQPAHRWRYRLKNYLGYITADRGRFD